MADRVVVTIKHLCSTLHLLSASHRLLVNSPSTPELLADFCRHVLLPVDEVTEVRRGRPVALPRVTQHGSSALALRAAADLTSYNLVSNPTQPPSRHPAKDCYNLRSR